MCVCYECIFYVRVIFVFCSGQHGAWYKYRFGTGVQDPRYNIPQQSELRREIDAQKAQVIYNNGNNNNKINDDDDDDKVHLLKQESFKNTEQ